MPITLTAEQWRARVGPRWRPQDHPAHFDWTAYEAGQADIFTGDKITTAAATSATTTIPVVSTSGLGSKGGSWIGDSGTPGGPWSYIEYTGITGTTLTGVTWEIATNEYAQSHNAGEKIRQWWSLDGKALAEMTIDRKANSNLSAATWTVSIRGLFFPQPALRRGHLIVIQTRPHMTGSYTTKIVGWITSVQMSQNKRRRGEWTIQIADITAMINDRTVEAKRIGGLDVGPQSSASGAQALSFAYKEAYSFDYTAAAPNLEAGSVVDGDSSTLWISEQVIGTYQWNTSNNDPMRDPYGPLIKTICLRRPAGYDVVGYRFIELQAQSPLQDTWLCFHDAGMNVLLDIGEPDYDPGQRCIIVENEDLYKRENPIDTSRLILEIPDVTWWNNIDPTAVMIGLLRANDPFWSHMVAVGNILTLGYTHVVGPTELWSDPDYPGHLYWTGPAIPALDFGQYAVYEPGSSASTTPADYWRVDERGAPGYEVGEWSTGSDETPNQGQLNPPHLLIELPTIDLFLKNASSGALDPGVGETLEIVTADGVNTTAGLPSSGTLQIGQEQITYSALDGKTGVVVSGRLVGGTGPAAHAAGDQIMLVVDGVATAAMPIEKIRMVRQQNTLLTAIIPRAFEVYYTRRVDARDPFEPNWTYDWDGPVSVTTNDLLDWSHPFSPSERVLKFCIVFYKMSTDPARARLNEFHAYLDQSLYDGEAVASPAPAGDIIRAILEDAGVPAGAITVEAGLPDVDAANTAKGSGWAVAASFADYVGARIEVSLDSRITVGPNTNITAAGSPDRSWDMTGAQEIRPKWDLAPKISQTKLTWYDSSGNKREAVYPATADAYGSDPMEAGPMVLASSTAAAFMAQRLYMMARYPASVDLDVPNGDPDIAPLELHRVEWTLDSAHADLDRHYIVAGATHTMRPGRTWQTSLTLQQIDIENEG